MQKFDLIIIGGGAGAFASAIRANELSAKGGSASGGKGTKLSIDYNAVPYTIFTDPQLAGVGFTEDEQMKQMGVCACRTVSFEDVPKALIMRRTVE